MTDVICANCGMHLNSVEEARDHARECKSTSNKKESTKHSSLSKKKSRHGSASSNINNDKWQIATSNEFRRQPVYFLLDTSYRMAGKPIQDIRLGIEAFKRDVGADPFAVETIHIAVITFGGEAKLVTNGLMPLDVFSKEFNTESITASGNTNLGQAFNILSQSLNKDVRKTVKGEQKGDFGSLVFILIGSEPDDDWRSARESILNWKDKVKNVMTVGCGTGITQDSLREIAIGRIIKMENDMSLKQFFVSDDWHEHNQPDWHKISRQKQPSDPLKKRKGDKVVSEQTADNGQEKTPTQPETTKWIITRSEGTRRLPVYLLLDTSGSMAGDPIRDVRLGVEAFKEQVASNVFAEETVHVGVITFGEEATFVTKGLVPITKFRNEFNTESLIANGQTPLGQALWLLDESLDKDIKSPVKGGDGDKGDYKPLIFILTDGEPTDEWNKPREAILERQQKKVINLITVGCGPRINQQTLIDISMGSPKGSTFIMGNDSEAFKKFFDWISQTTGKIAKSVSQPDGGDRPTDIDQPPFQYIP